MPKNIVNIADLPWQSSEHGDFTFEDKCLGLATGGEKLGATLYKLMPGKKAFPYHFHFANEEAVFVLSGLGSLRMKDAFYPIKEGDYITFPVGADYAHQISNNSNAPLIFLCFSTMIHPDVSVYPDSQKISVSAGIAPGGDMEKSLFKKRYRIADEVDYFEGEETNKN